MTARKDASLIHENLSTHRKVKQSSDRAFAFTIAAFFSILAFAPIFFRGSLRIWPLLPAAFFVVAAFLFPAKLAPLKRIWLKFGAVIHGIMTPLIMGMFFVFLFVPLGLLLRLLGNRLLELSPDPKASSYWITRAPGAEWKRDMRKQY